MRDESGRFVKGQSGNPKGRAPRRTEQEYLDAVVGSVSLADMKEIAKKAVAQAKRGDARARQWVSDYLLGPAPQIVRHGGEEGGAIAIEVRFVDAAQAHPDASAGD